MVFPTEYLLNFRFQMLVEGPVCADFALGKYALKSGLI
jgi:hypothetical protein